MTADRVTTAVVAAVSYLDRMRRGGLWNGFPTLAGSSDLWVSGYSAAQLAELSAVKLDLSDTVEALLAARQSDGGWSFGRDVPTDADSTAWCITAVRAIDPTARLSDAQSVLADHRRGHGYATYRSDSGIASFVGYKPERIGGWTSPHPDVTAAVVLAGPPEWGSADEDVVLAQLISEVTATGLIPSYWWRGNLYGTAIALRALQSRGRRLPADREAAIARGLKRMQLDDGGYGLGSATSCDPFTTALALEAWCRIPHLDSSGLRHRAAEALLASQLPTGGWLGDFVLRIPCPDVLDPRLVSSWSRGTGGGNSFVPDVDGIFATATAAYALDLWMRASERPTGTLIEVSSTEGPGPDEVVLVPGPN